MYILRLPQLRDPPAIAISARHRYPQSSPTSALWLPRQHLAGTNFEAKGEEKVFFNI